jgi:hypothetical protein
MNMWIDAVKTASLPILAEQIANYFLKKSPFASRAFEIKTLIGLIALAAALRTTPQKTLTAVLYLSYKLADLLVSKAEKVLPRTARTSYHTPPRAPSTAAVPINRPLVQLSSADVD